jgi:hypothetical protein
MIRLSFKMNAMSRNQRRPLLRVWRTLQLPWSTGRGWVGRDETYRHCIRNHGFSECTLVSVYGTTGLLEPMRRALDNLDRNSILHYTKLRAKLLCIMLL